MRHASEFHSEMRTRFVLTHDLTSAMTEAVEHGNYDFALFGWGDAHPYGDSLGHHVHEVVKRADCDLAVLKDRGLSHTSRILVTADIGHYARLEVTIADNLGNWYGAPVEFIRVVEDASDPERMAPIKHYLSSLSDLCTSPSSYRVIADTDPARAIWRPRL